jgi:uncharacterized membrane protein YdjX (TVP38/TMEM64 family)
MSENSSGAPTPEATPAPKNAGSWWPRLLFIFGIAAVIVAFYATGLDERLSASEIRDRVDYYRGEVEANQALAVVTFLCVYVLVTALSLPVAVWLSLLAGALFGRWLGTSVVLIAATTGATLAFLSSRYLFRGYVQGMLGSRLSALNSGIEREGAYYLFTLRLIPLFPFWLINLGMGLTPMRTLTFASISFFGMLPGTFIYVNAGNELANIRSPKDIMSLPLIASLALIGLLPLVLRLTSRYWRRTQDGPHT